MNLRQGWKNILLQHCYKIFLFVTVWPRATRPRFFSGKNLWVRGCFLAGESPATTWFDKF